LSETGLGIKTKKLHVKVKGGRRVRNRERTRGGSKEEKKKNWSDKKGRTATEEWEKGTVEENIKRWR
jgi:hypothetical protein